MIVVVLLVVQETNKVLKVKKKKKTFDLKFLTPVTMCECKYLTTILNVNCL